MKEIVASIPQMGLPCLHMSHALWCLNLHSYEFHLHRVWEFNVEVVIDVLCWFRGACLACFEVVLEEMCCESNFEVALKKM